MNRKQRRTEEKRGRPADKRPPDLRAVFAEALRCHQAGRLAEAEQLYRKVLTGDPRHADSLHLLGVLAGQAGQHAIAVERIAEAIARSGAVAQYHANLGNALYQLGRFEEAATSQCRAIALQPDLAEAHDGLGSVLFRLGRAEEAAACHRRAIELRPAYLQAHNNLGNALQQLGRLEEALSSYRQTIALNPDFAEAHNNLGNMLQRQGRLAEAVACYRRAIAARPDFAEAHYNLGNALREQGQAAEAAECYRRAVECQPDYAEAYNNLGNAFQDQQRLDEAIAAYRRALALRPAYLRAHNNLGNALRERGRLEEAVACHCRAIDIDPAFAEAHNSLGNVRQKQGRTTEAIVCHQRAIALRPDYHEAHNNLGNALLEAGRLEEAIACYHQALALKPDLAEAYYNLGNALQQEGRLDEAYCAYERAAELAPRRGAFYRMLAANRPLAANDPQLARMEALAAEMEALPEVEQMELNFALGTAYSDSGQSERSFRHLLAANRIRRRHTAYDEAATLALFDRLRRVFTAELMASAPESRSLASPVPIFVVGMPRSGTTLVEQILASHPQVFGAGELPELPRLAAGLASVGGDAGFPEAVPLLAPERIADLGAAYRTALRAHAPAAARIVDKLPDNFLRLGLIHLALPDAKIIHLRRDPVDTCFSCFSKLFTGQQPYSYDLAELGRYYRAYEGLMAHWRRVLPPGLMLELHYEALVADLEGETRRLLVHCGVDWDDRCLAFHETRRPVRTASAAQVRRPLYADSVGRWQSFRALAQPLLEALGA